MRSDPVTLAREKRFRKRETADGAGVTIGITISGVVDELATGDEGMTTADARAGEPSRLSGTGGFVPSTLERGGDPEFSTFGSVRGIDDTLRFKNESNPPPGFLGVASAIVTRSSFSRIRHPIGVSSAGASFLARTDFSHSIDPLEASSRAIGLLRVKGICLVSLSELFTALAVAVCENCTGGGRDIFSGIKSFNKTVLNVRRV